MDIAENNVVKFISLSKKKDGRIFANYRVKGVKGGATFSSSITVDISEANVDVTEPMEKIIDECAKVAVREFEKTKFRIELAPV